MPTDEEYPDFSVRDAVQILRTAICTLRENLPTLLRCSALAAMVGLLFAFGLRPEYRSSTKLLPYRASGSASGIMGLAGLAGLRLPSGAGGGEQTITADLYPEVARTLDFKIEVAETPIGFSSEGRLLTTAKYFSEIRKAGILELAKDYTIGLPGHILSLLRPAAVATEPIAGDSTMIPFYSRKYLKTIQQLDERLSVTIDKKTAVITIAGLMPDRHASAALVRAASERLTKRIIDYEVLKASEQLRYVEEQHARTKVMYERAQRALASFVDRNRVLISATSQIERERLQRDHDLRFEIYQELSRQVEQAKLKQSQDTPVYTVLEGPTVPADRYSPRRSRIMILSLGVGLIVGLLRVFWRTSQAQAKL